MALSSVAAVSFSSSSRAFSLSSAPHCHAFLSSLPSPNLKQWAAYALACKISLRVTKKVKKMLDKISVFMKDTGRGDIVEAPIVIMTRWSTRWFLKEKARRIVMMMQKG